MFDVVFVAIAWGSVLLALIPLFFLIKPYNRQRKWERLPKNISQPAFPVSIVIYFRDNREGLLSLMDSLNRQQYDGDREIIIACDPEVEGNKEFIARLQNEYASIYVTYVPEETRNVSRRKLAFNLGVKASNSEHVLLVTSNTRIISDLWLASISRCFESGSEVVIGAETCESFPGSGLTRCLRKFDYVLSTLTWASAALSGHAFRGTGNNLAFKREVFFQNKGYAGSLNYHYGDDDIFVKEVASAHPTCLNVSPDGLVIRRHTNSAKEWERGVRSRMFTLHGLGRTWRWLSGSLFLLAWLNLAASVLGIVFSISPDGFNALFLGLSVASLIGFMILIWRMLSLSARFVRIRLNFVQVYWGILMCQLLTVTRRMKLKREKETNYTWKPLR